MGLEDSILLRTASDPNLVAKGSSLTWTEEDTNFIIIANLLRSLQAVDTTNFEAYNAGTEYEQGDFVSYDGNVYEYINATPQTGITPGTDPLTWEITSQGLFTHERNKDQFLDQGGSFEISAEDIFNGLNSIPVISDSAYDETAWNGDTDGATKNALRDKFFTIDAAISGIDLSNYYSKTGNNFGGDAILGLTSNHNLSIYTNNLERIKITNTGLVAVAQKLLVGDTDTSLLSTRDMVVAGSGNTSASFAFVVYNSDFGSPTLASRNDGALLLSTGLLDSSGVDIMDIPNRTFKSNSGADRVDCNGAGLYFSGLRLDWQNRLLLGQWQMDDEDLKFNLDTKGIILKDRTLGTYHRLVLNSGALSIEAE